MSQKSLKFKKSSIIFFISKFLQVPMSQKSLKFKKSSIIFFISKFLQVPMELMYISQKVPSFQTRGFQKSIKKDQSSKKSCGKPPFQNSTLNVRSFKIGFQND